MLDPGGNDMVARLSPSEKGTFDRMVVGFTAAAGEDDLFAGTSKESSHLTACFFHSGLGGRSGPEDGKRVEQLVALGRALSDPIRVRMLGMLADMLNRRLS